MCYLSETAHERHKVAASRPPPNIQGVAMRLVSALLLVLGLALVPRAFAAQQKGAQAPPNAPDNTVEQIYLDSEVRFDEIHQSAYDFYGFPVNGTIQSFYPSGRLSSATQWADGKLHGVTRMYYENRQIKEETTWVNGKLHGLARWYDEKGNLLREALYENGKDPEAPDDAPEQNAARDEAEDAPADTDASPGESPQKDKQ